MVPCPNALTDPRAVVVKFEDTLYIRSAFVHFQL
jgi:hypothetical protein